MEPGTSPVKTDHFTQGASTCPLLFWVFSPALQIVDAPSHRLAEGETSLGREPEGPRGLVLGGDPGVSRQHAVVHHDARTGLLTLRDLSSRQSTWVNGQRPGAGQPLPLHRGDVLRVGDSVLVVGRGPEDAAEQADAPGLAEILGRSPLLAEVKASLVRVAGAKDLPVLLLGEPGTGKERAAQALHKLSGRGGRFVPVDCGALSPNLVESAFFGHVRGAFTGASAPREGLFSAADGGSLFLDEIGNLDAELQAKLLRVLSERRVRPVGAEGHPGQAFDVLLLSATNRLLREDAQAGRFRPDLYRRIAGVVLTLPPLRVRREDILCLLRDLPEGQAGPPPRLPLLHTSQVELLLLYDWPGNVGELAHVRGHLCTLGFDANLRDRLRPGPVPTAAGAPGQPAAQRAPLDREALAALLSRHQGKIQRIHKETGWSRRTILDLVKKFGLSHLRKE